MGPGTRESGVMRAYQAWTWQGWGTPLDEGPGTRALELSVLIRLGHGRN